MAIATGTALAVASLTATAAGTGMSFAQAGKQGKLQRQAESEAEKAMQEAEKAADVNFYEALAIQKEPYELEREAALSAGAQAIEALREGEARGAGAGVGRVQMAQQEAQAGIRTAMGQELMGLEMATAEEESRLRDIGIQLNLEEAAGAQQAAADAQAARAQAIQQGMEGVTSMIQQGVSAAPLFEKGAAGRQLSRLQKSALGSGISQGDYQKSIAALGSVGGVDVSKFGGLSPDQFQSAMLGLGAGNLRDLRGMLPTTLQSFNPARTSLQIPQQYQYNPFQITSINPRILPR
jgi:hypothetical protein